MSDPPCPPDCGWTLIQAAEALFPDLVEACRSEDNRRDAFRRLSITLGRIVLRERDDLAIAGHDLARGVDAPHVVVPRALYGDDTMPEGSWFALDIWNSTFELRLPPPTPTILLRAVRVISAKDRPRDGAGPGSPVTAPSSALSERPTPRAVEGEPRKVYSEAALRAWYRLRGHTWNASQPAPSEADDRAAVEADFGVAIPREQVRKVRRELAPPSWRKSGKRKGR
jgi:hypothetical protein